VLPRHFLSIIPRQPTNGVILLLISAEGALTAIPASLSALFYGRF
jgi:hypothetical protein